MFKFNNFRVCINPNVHVIIDEPNYHAEVKTASKNDRWFYGYGWTNHIDGYGGASSGASYNYNHNLYDSENDAIEAAIEEVFVKSLYDFSYANPKYRKECNKLIDKCHEYISNLHQLSLWE